jgi:modulator of FtsH protease HflC
MTIFIIIGITFLVAMLILLLMKMRFACAFTLGFIIIIIIRSGFFMVTEGSQVVITQFGNIVGKPYTKAGLYVKVPLIWKANYIDKRLFTEEEYQPGIATKDGYFITLTTVFFWEVTDSEKYINSIDDIKKIKIILRNIVSGAMRQGVSHQNILDTIQTRGGSDHLQYQQLFSQASINKSESTLEIDFPTPDSNFLLGSKKHDISGSPDRETLINKVFEEANKEAASMGITVKKVLITRVEYSSIVEDMIIERMIAERLRAATKLISEGQSESKRINGKAIEDQQKIIAPAEKEALIIVGNAEAEAANITAKAYGKNREFYNYWRTLNGYKDIFNLPSSQMLLSTEIPYLNFITNKEKKLVRPNASETTITEKGK